MDHHSVFGLLLGQVYTSHAEIRAAVPLSHTERFSEEEGTTTFAIDKSDRIQAAHAAVNRKMAVIGWYSNDATHGEALNQRIRETFFPPDRHKAPPFFLHLVVNESTVLSEAGEVTIQPYLHTEQPDGTDEVRKLAYTYALSDLERIATVALTSPVDDTLVAEAPRLKALSGLPGAPSPLTNAVGSLRQSIQTVLDHVKEIVDNNVPADPRLARLVLDALATLPVPVDNFIEGPVNDSVQSLLAVHFVAKMATTHAHLAEQLHKGTSATLAQ